MQNEASTGTSEPLPTDTSRTANHAARNHALPFKSMLPKLGNVFTTDFDLKPTFGYP